MKPYNWRQHLHDDEALLWTGRPFPALALIKPTTAEWLIGGLGAVGVAALIVLDRWIAGGAAEGSGSGRAMVFLVLLLIALLVTGWPFRAMRQRSLNLRRVSYAVTDRRAMIAHDRDPSVFRAHEMPRSARPVLEPGPYGLSTLHFGANGPWFEHLKDGERIVTAINAARKAAAEERRNTP